MKKSLFLKIKYAAGIVIAIAALFWTVWLNAEDIKNGNDMPQTIEASRLRNVDYFTDFSLRTMDGENFTQENLEGYTITVFNVWQPYCASCLKEMPQLDELAEELKGEGVQLVNINGYAYVSPEDNELAAEQMGERQIKMPKLMADRAFSETLLPVLKDAYPGTFIVDSQGKILDFVSGSKSKEAWKSYLLEFCGE